MVCSHQKPAPIPTQILYGPAKIALEAMLSLRIASPSLLERWPSENLSQDAEMLLDVCNTLKRRRSQEPNLENDLHVHVGNILPDLSYGTVLMLALMTWHFDASSSKASQDLIIFLRWPDYSEIRILQDRYQGIMCETAPSNFDFLLI
ncbi:Pc06g02080 [Penicillium rubens Wisconsin 54-1255]|uniref:Pc06g02080 protein n=1 Tax=Penicillium rubens (strain ATCC 28089 / DSM 1075 / NRRL 1951 / Wisconsin 54-1255) TaxID=500485 RepID=B6GWA9_PENRW|nr:Pc06g02080 [Penicillium rubens Wisconsin 54-1255]